MEAASYIKNLREKTGMTKYWNKLKQRLNDEGSELVTKCHQLKMKSPKDFEENKGVANRGGNIAGNARKALEEELGHSVITSENAMQLNHVVEAMIEASAGLSE